MKNKLIVILLVIALATGGFIAFNTNNSDNTPAPLQSADGYDILKGTWYVGAIYYNNRLLDISDNNALSDLYDTTFLAFREDGTFTFSDIFMRDGTYTRKDTTNGKETFVLKTDRVYTYSFVDGKMVEKDKEDGAKTSYILTFNSSDSFEFVEMDPMTGAAKASATRMVFELSGEESDYISSNKTEINNTTKKETTTKKSTPSYNSGSTAGQRNALEAAKRYLSVMPFSHEGLIEQLEYEGYSYSEAKFAADNCGADWYAQAVKHAKKYLDTMPFSKNDLIEQLIYEGYTRDQATHGANEAYY